MTRPFVHRMISKYKEYTRLQKLCVWILCTHIFIALFAPVLANDLPLFCNLNGQWSFPVFDSSPDFNKEKCSFRIMAPIPWSSGSIDAASSGYASPLHRSGNHMHWLGTDALGRDVLAGLIYGTRYAWIIGLLSTLFAAIPGVFIGMMIGYWKNNKLRWNLVQSIAVMLLTLFFIYEFRVLYWIVPSGIMWMTCLLALGVYYLLAKLILKLTAGFGKKMNVPLDHLVMRSIDLFESFPKILLLMALMVIMNRPSIITLSLLIALIRWTLFTQITRNETLKESVSNYVISAENFSIPWHKILIQHIWPNIKQAILVSMVFTFSASVLLEASLSFIGLGLRLETVTWGGLLNEGRNYLPGWWLSVFPGLAIFSLLFALNWFFIIKDRSTRDFDLAQ